MNMIRVDYTTKKSSKIFEELISGNYSTGLYYISYLPNGSVVEKISDDGTPSPSSVIVNKFISLLLASVNKQEVNKVSLDNFRQLVLLSRTTNKKLESSPYIVYLVNENGIKTSFFLKMDDDDYLRFSYNYKL